MNKKPLSPISKTSRVSVPVTSEVHDVFKRLSKAGGMSVGKTMAEWLADTVEAAEYTANMMEKARAAPKIVMREIHAYSLGLADETGALMRQISEKGRADRASAKGLPCAGPGGAAVPPSSNTGGKVPRINPNPRGLKP